MQEARQVTLSDNRVNALFTFVYRAYSRNGLLRRVYLNFLRSALATRLIFGVRPYRGWSEFPDFQAYFDLTTVCLWRVLREELRRHPDARLCEIGLGAFAILSRALARHAHQPIVASDFNRDTVELARRHVAADDVDVEIIQSTVLSDYPKREFDIIFWNLPYYQDPETYLPELFKTVPGFLAAEGKLVIGYNPGALSRARVMDILARYPRLRLGGIRRAWWNRHDVLVIEPNGGVASA